MCLSPLEFTYCLSTAFSMVGPRPDLLYDGHDGIDKTLSLFLGNFSRTLD